VTLVEAVGVGLTIEAAQLDAMKSATLGQKTLVESQYGQSNGNLIDSTVVARNKCYVVKQQVLSITESNGKYVVKVQCTLSDEPLPKALKGSGALVDGVGLSMLKPFDSNSANEELCRKFLHEVNYRETFPFIVLDTKPRNSYFLDVTAKVVLPQELKNLPWNIKVHPMIVYEDSSGEVVRWTNSVIGVPLGAIATGVPFMLSGALPESKDDLVKIKKVHIYWGDRL
jgi:hypothetical protein